jgi:hypothetical protein
MPQLLLSSVYGLSMQLMPDSTLTITGITSFNLLGIILRTSIQGNVTWAKTFKTPRSSGTTLVGFCELSNSIKTQDGNILIYGPMADTLTPPQYIYPIA